MEGVFGNFANMNRSDLAQTIQEALKKKGMSAKEASQKAVGNDALIANIGRTRYGAPRFDTLEALAEVLDLELYFGPKRPAVAETVQKLSYQFAPALAASRQAMANHGFSEEPVHFQPRTAAPVSRLIADMPGWAEPEPTDIQYPLPEGADEAGEYLQLKGGGCAAKGVAPDATLLIDRSLPPAPGDVALLTDRNGRQLVRRIIEEEAGWLTTAGYQFEDGAWTRFSDKWKTSAIAERAKVVAAFERPPSADEAQINLLAAQPVDASQPIPIGRASSGQPVIFASPDWIDGDTDALDLVTVPDAAMEPLLREGATVIIRTDTPLVDGAVVATLTKGRVALHRFKREAGGGAFFWHDNPAHPPISAPAGSEEVHILGRAIWAGFWLDPDTK